MYVGCFDVGIPRRLLRGQVAETLRERGDSKMINPLVAQYPNPISTQKYRSEQIGKRREWVSGIGITGQGSTSRKGIGTRRQISGKHVEPPCLSCLRLNPCTWFWRRMSMDRALQVDDPYWEISQDSNTRLWVIVMQGIKKNSKTYSPPSLNVE